MEPGHVQGHSAPQERVMDLMRVSMMLATIQIMTAHR
jgi:hypothetical protein